MKAVPEREHGLLIPGTLVTRGVSKMLKNCLRRNAVVSVAERPFKSSVLQDLTIAFRPSGVRPLREWLWGKELCDKILHMPIQKAPVVVEQASIVRRVDELLKQVFRLLLLWRSFLWSTKFLPRRMVFGYFVLRLLCVYQERSF